MASKVTYTIRQLDTGFYVTGTEASATTPAYEGACSTLALATTFVTETESTRQAAITTAAATPAV